MNLNNISQILELPHSAFTICLITVSVFLFSFYIVFFLLPKIILISKKKNIISPIVSRSSHSKQIPRLGGFGIFFSLIMATNIISMLNYDDGSLNSVQFSLILIFLIGLYDDLKSIKAGSKLKGQLLCVLPVLFCPQLMIYFPNLSSELALLSTIAVFYIIIIFCINSFNLIDGVDGLAGSVGILISSSYSIIFFLNESYTFFFLNLALIGAIAGFLQFNFRNDRLKIFMGDCGSLIIGLLIGLSTIKYLNITTLENEALPVQLRTINLILSILFIPIFDTTRVMIIRIRAKSSPFSADRNHLHHFFLDRKKTHLKTVLIILCINILCTLINVVIYRLECDFYIGLLFNLMFGIGLSLLIKHKKKHAKYTLDTYRN